MAIGAGTVFQIQSTATAGNVNGGAFNPGNANGITDGVIAGGTGSTPTLSSATYTFLSADINHWIYFPTQSNMYAGWYQITGVNAGVATLAAGIGTAQIVTNNMFGTNSVAGCASTAAPTGVTYLVDYSQTDTARYTSTTMTGATTAATDASGNPFTAQMVGNFICAASGTGVTAGWYEILSVSTGTATLSSSAGTTYSLVHAHIGGAVSLGGTTTGITDTIFFGLAISSTTAAGRYFIKGGASVSYSLGQAIGAGNAGSTVWPIIFEGYAVTRGDRPLGSTMPTIAGGAFLWQTAANNVDVYSLAMTSTATSTYLGAARGKVIGCKIVNTSTTAGRVAFSANQSGISAIKSEFISYRGNAISPSGGSVLIDTCYIHDSNIGISTNGSGSAYTIINNIIANNVTEAINIGDASTTTGLISGNTLYGSENKLGIGINIITGTDLMTVMNNNIYGFVTGITAADTQTVLYGDYNNFYNNTNDVSAATQWQKGRNDISVAPSFANVAQVTGTTATSSTTTLTDSGKNFTTAGVVAGRDFLYVISGTGATAGIYGITAVGTTTLTTDISLGTISSGGTYQITTGKNFAVGTSLKAKGYPGLFPGGYTTGYLDIGAVQRQEPNSANILQSSIIQGLGAV